MTASLTAAWPRVQLAEVIKQRKEWITISDVVTYKRCRVQLHAKGVVLRDAVQGTEIKTKSQQVCRADDFLVAEIDAKVGGYGIVPIELEGAVVSSHYFLFEVNQNLLDLQFLDYFIRTPAFQDQVAAQGSTNYAAIRPSHVLEYEIPLPPLDEQRRIVARLEGLAAKIEQARELRRQVTSELEIFSAKAYKQAFQNHVSKTVPLGSIFKVTTGGTPSRSNLSFWNGDIKWVSSGEVKFCRILDTEEKITQVGVDNSNAKVYPPNTVLIAMIGQGKTRGQTAILDCHAATNQNVAGIHVYATEHDPNYVYWWLRSRYQESRLDETGTAAPALSGERVKQMTIILPSVEEQRRIVAYLDALQARVEVVKDLQAATAAELDALLPALLDKAFKGEL